MRKILTLAIPLCLLLCACGAEKEETGDITEIKLYTFEYTLPEDDEDYREPIIITDEKTIEELVELGGDKDLYEPWGGDYYEGMNSYWIDYGDGFIVGMYDDIDYGNFCAMAGEPYGGPYYEIPEGLRDKIIELTEK